MALVKTDGCFEAEKYSSPEQFVRAVRGAMADELSAANLYSHLAESAYKTYGNKAATIVKQLEDIQADEHNHLGILLSILENLDECGFEDIKLGFHGEEAPEDTL
jgi:rubrerythrin